VPAPFRGSVVAGKGSLEGSGWLASQTEQVEGKHKIKEPGTKSDRSYIDDGKMKRDRGVDSPPKPEPEKRGEWVQPWRELSREGGGSRALAGTKDWEARTPVTHVDDDT